MLMLWLSALMAGCHSSSDEPEPPLPHRSVLVYMVASNNLESYAAMDVEEMKAAAKAGGVNGGHLIVYHISKSDAPRLFEVTPEGNLELIKEYDRSQLSVSASRMEEVIADFKQAAPARDYGMELWSHGSGWLVDGIDDAPVAPASFGQDGSSKMNVSSLASVLEGKGFSFLYFDCCYMGSVEVLYELRRCAPYIVGSPSELPVYGMDYTANVPCFFASGEADLEQAVKNTYEYYQGQEEAKWRTCTISLVKTSELDRLASAARDIFASAPWPAVSDYQPQRYMSGRCYHYDLRDYCQDIAADEALVARLDEALAATVVCEYATDYLWRGLLGEIKILHHCGISSFVPTNAGNVTLQGYDTLPWYRDVVSAMTERN